MYVFSKVEKPIVSETEDRIHGKIILPLDLSNIHTEPKNIDFWTW